MFCTSTCILSIFNDLCRPWECLIQCLLPEWVLSNFDRQDKMEMEGNTVCFFSAVFQVTSQVDLLIFQRHSVSEQSSLHLTTVEHLSVLVLFVSLSVFLFSLLHVIKFKHDPSATFETAGTTCFCTWKKFASLNVHDYFETSSVSVLCYMSDHQVSLAPVLFGWRLYVQHHS